MSRCGAVVPDKCQAVSVNVRSLRSCTTRTTTIGPQPMTCGLAFDTVSLVATFEWQLAALVTQGSTYLHAAVHDRFKCIRIEVVLRDKCVVHLTPPPMNITE